jgi:RNA polymerase sigma-70 factor (ECF subfamily)
MINAQPSDSDTLVQAGTPSAGQSWSRLVKRIQSGDPSAMEEMYGVFTTGIRFYLCRQLGPQDLDDRVHEAFVTIAQSIRKGEVRQPERLMGYVRTVVRRQVAAQIEAMMEQRRRQIDPSLGGLICDRQPNPEIQAIEQEHIAVAYRVLQSLPQRDREVLVRFYLQEQSPAEICREMDLSATQFRLTKSRAKIRFAELGQARLARRHGFQPRE